jgi:hypothetical protein
MDSIKSYLMTLIVVSITAGVINIFSPEGVIKKYIKYAVSLSVVIILLLPFKDLIYTIPKLMNDYDLSNLGNNAVSVSSDDVASSDWLLAQLTVNNIEANLSQMIDDRFGLKDTEIEIIYDAGDSQEIVLSKVNVIINDDITAKEDIIYYVNDVLMNGDKQNLEIEVTVKDHE